MPQKRNGAGEMQNYVPAGNGEASGQYGDSEGNNKNIQFSDIEKKVQNKKGLILSEKSIDQLLQRTLYSDVGKKELSEAIKHIQGNKESKNNIELLENALNYLQNDKNFKEINFNVQSLIQAMNEAGELKNDGTRDVIESELGQTIAICEDTGFEVDKAEKVLNAIRNYTSIGYKDKESEDAKLMQEYLEQAPKYKGTIYRGMHVNPDKAEYILNTLNSGKALQFENISSWSEDEDVAKSFTSDDDYISDTKMVFKIKNKSGVSIKHLSTVNYEEEVLLGENKKFRLINMEKTGENFYNIEMEEL